MVVLVNKRGKLEGIRDGKCIFVSSANFVRCLILSVMDGILLDSIPGMFL